MDDALNSQIARARAIKSRFDATKASRPSEAARAAAEIQVIAHGTDNPELHALASWTAGMIALQHAGETEQALALLDAAVAGFEQTDHDEEAAAVQVSRLHALAILGRYDEAREAAQRALVVFERRGDELAAGKIEQNLGNIAWRRERYAEAERLFRSARARFVEVGDALQLAQIDNNLGGVLALQYRLDEAAAHYDQALVRADAANLDVTRAEIAVNIGCLALARGQFGRALAELENARRRYATLDLPHKLANAEKELADAYLELNLLPEAADVYARVIPTFERLGMRAELAWALTQFGRVLQLSGQTDAAKSRLEVARGVFAAEGNVVGEAMVTLAEAELLVRQGNDLAAARCAELAEQLLSTAGTSGRTVLARWLRGEIARRLGHTEQARALLESVIAEDGERDLPHVAHRCHTSLGLMAVAAADFPAARAHFERAVELVEALGAQLPAEEFRTAFGTDKLVPYLELLRLALSRGDADGTREAFLLAERARSRVLSDLMASAPRDEFATDRADPELLAQVERLRHELAWIYGQMLRLDMRRGDSSVGRRGYAPAMTRLHGAVRTREAALQEVLRQRAIAREPEASARTNAHQTLPELGDGAALVAYFSLDDELLAFVVRDERIETVRGLASMANVEQAVGRFRFQIDALMFGGRGLRAHVPQLTHRTRQRLRHLYQMLLAPLEHLLDGADRLVVVPHRRLHYVPFHALHDGEGYVVERLEVSYSPSAAVLRHCLARAPRHPPARAVLIGIADEGARRVSDELTRIAAHFPEPVAHLGAEATLAAVRRDGPTADVLHLATHGRFRPDNPLFSALRLADGWLTVGDASELNLRDCQLVALSACDTGVSQVAAGDELLGLTRGFFAAGAASLLVSLWPVDDAATVTLMDAFYARFREGAPPAAALRSAQRQLLADDAHPFYWAAFALHGRF